MLQQDSQPSTVQPLSLRPAQFCLPLRSWSPQSHYLVSVSFDELFSSHICAAKAEASSDDVVHLLLRRPLFFAEDIHCLPAPSPVASPAPWAGPAASPGLAVGRDISSPWPCYGDSCHPTHRGMVLQVA